MAETPEIPEAKDPFGKRVAVTIAILAVIVSFTAIIGEDSRTESIIKTNLATNKWGYFQAKSIKEHLVKVEKEIIASVALAPAAAERQTVDTAKLNKEIERYTEEKEAIKKDAEELEHDADKLIRTNKRCDIAILILQIAIILSSVAILSHWKILWFTGIAVGVAGTAVALTALLIK